MFSKFHFVLSSAAIIGSCRRRDRSTGVFGAIAAAREHNRRNNKDQDKKTCEPLFHTDFLPVNKEISRFNVSFYLFRRNFYIKVSYKFYLKEV
jgi:hypothetical protein